MVDVDPARTLRAVSGRSGEKQGLGGPAPVAAPLLARGQKSAILTARVPPRCLTTT